MVILYELPSRVYCDSNREEKEEAEQKKKVTVLMEGYTDAPHQVAGHDGVLIDSSGSLFIKPSTQKEIDFYTQLNSAESPNDSAEDTLSDWVPRFMGVLEAGISEKAAESQEVSDEMRQLDKEIKSNGTTPIRYIVLENLLHGFRNPSIIDIKLGSVLTDDYATEEKKQRLAEVSKTTTSGSHHFRVCGMKLYNELIPDLSNFQNVEGHVNKDDKGYISFDKWFGRGLDEETLDKCFQLFFNHNKLNQDQRQIVIRNTFTRLQLLYNCLLSQEVRMRSSSLLIAYENNLERWDELNGADPIYKDECLESDDDEENEDEDSKSKALSFAVLIDFAHSEFTPGKGYDNDIVTAIENLLALFEKLLQ